MKERYKEKTIKLPIYPSIIVFIETNSYQKVYDNHGIDLKSEPRSDAIMDFTKPKRNGYCTRKYYIILDTKPKVGDVKIPTMVHECFHISSMICKQKGIKADHDNDEAQAYMLDYIVNEALFFFFGIEKEKV